MRQIRSIKTALKYKEEDFHELPKIKIIKNWNGKII